MGTQLVTKPNYKRYIGSVFVFGEMVLHCYLLFYLTFITWTNWLIWGFTAFELFMFLFLLLNRDGDHHIRGHSNLRELCDGYHVEDKTIAYKPYQK